MINNFSEHELKQIIKHYTLYMKLLDEHYSKYNPNSLVCDLMETADFVRTKAKKLLFYYKKEDNMTPPSFECSCDKFGILISECVKMSEVLNKLKVENLSFTPMGEEWIVAVKLSNGEVWKGAKSLSKGESLKSLHTMLTGLVRKEINRMKTALGKDIEE